MSKIKIENEPNVVKKLKDSFEPIDQSTFLSTVSTFTDSPTSGRQRRAARMKVTNYKPVPLNVKMRRD